MRSGSWLLVVGALLAAAAAAEDLVLFSAQETPTEMWAWDQAKIERMEGKLLVANRGAKGQAGSVFLEDRFAYLPGAMVDLDVERVVAGDYALQILGFKGDIYLGSVDLVKGSMRTGRQSFQLATAKMPVGTDRVTFKFWLSKGPSSGLVLNDLRYHVPLMPEQVAYDRIVDASLTNAIADTVSWTVSDAGGTLTLPTNAPYGSVVFPDQIAKPEQGGTLVIQTTSLTNATLTAQACIFDAFGNYVSSLDVVKRATASLSVSLAPLPWPVEGATFQVKLWIGGTSNASATVRRILVVN